MADSTAAARVVALLVVALVLAGVAWVLLEPGQSRSMDPAALGRRDAPEEFAASEPPAPLAEPAAPRAPDATPTTLAAPEAVAGRLAGRVLRLADRSPLAGWAVMLPAASGNDDTPPRGAVLDDHGAFTLDDVPRDTPHLLLRRAVGGGRVVAELPLPDDAFARDDLELLADTGWTLAGTVRDDAGAPLADATVSARRDRAASTDAEGRFRLRDVPAPEGSAPLTLAVHAPLHTRVERPLHLVGPSSLRDDLAFTLEPAGALVGRVLGADGFAYPVERVTLPFRDRNGWLVSVSPELSTSAAQTLGMPPPARGPGGAVDPELAARTEDPVHYRIDHVPPGRYVLRAEPGRGGLDVDGARQLAALGYLTNAAADSVAQEAAAGGDPALAAPEHWLDGVEVAAGTLTTVDIHLPWGAALTGRVLDAAGTPQPDARVELLHLRRWHFPDGGRGHSAQVDADWQLIQRDAEAGGSEALLEVRVAEATTDSAGRYTLERLPPGAARLRVVAPAALDLRPVELPIELRAGERLEREVFLEAGLDVRGRVLDPDGRPVEGAQVMVHEPAPTLIFTADDIVRTDADGRFRVTGLEPGDWRLQVHATGFLSQTREVQPGGPPLELVLQPAERLDGRVLHAATGAPITSFTLTIRRGNGITQMNLSDEQGRFAVDDLDVGEVTLTIAATGFRTWESEPLRPELGEGRDLEVRLEPAG